MSSDSSGKPSGLKAWEKLGSEVLQKTFAFDLCVQRLKSPRTGAEGDYFYLDLCDWVNIIPVTSDGLVVMIEQYRWGINEITLEFPGGMLNKGESDPKEAAIREMVEETGYSSEVVEDLGFCHPNPAILNNRNFSYLALGVEKISAQCLDQGEDISVRLVKLSDLPSLIEQHQITHSLSLTALLRYFAKYGLPR